MGFYMNTLPENTVEQCYFHGVEPVPPGGYYIMCMECGHCYDTEDDLRRAYRVIVEQWAASSLARGCHDIDPLTVPPASDIYFCQECAHDF
jgi:hypothetical protein